MGRKNETLLVSTLLGGAALLTAQASMAADLPSRKAEPASYMRICDAYGAGFFVIPGTDTCMRFTQSVNAVYYTIPAQNMMILSQVKNGYNATNTSFSNTKTTWDPGVNGNLAYQNYQTQDSTGWQSDNRFGIDTRTPTAYGTLRTAAGLRFKYESGIMASSGSAISVSGAGGSESKIALDKAYVQYLGFTAGFLPTPFSFYYEDDVQTELQEPHGSPVVLNYTGILGNGFSFQAGIDTNAFHVDKAEGASAASCCAAGLDANANHRGVSSTLGRFVYPDLDMNVRVDQAWGSAMLGLLVHPINELATNQGFYNGNAAQSFTGVNAGLPSVNVSTVGFAALAGVKFNLPMLAEGDQLWLQGIYSDGALEAAGIGGNQGNISQGSQGLLLGGLVRNDQDAIMVANNDGTFTLEKEKVLTGLLAFHHYWVPDVWRSNFLMSYTVVTPGTQTQNTDWLKGGLAKATSLKVGANVVWSPVKGLEFTAEFMHTNLWTKLATDPGQAPTCFGSAGASATACQDIAYARRVSPANWAGLFQVHRGF